MVSITFSLLQKPLSVRRFSIVAGAMNIHDPLVHMLGKDEAFGQLGVSAEIKASPQLILTLPSCSSPKTETQREN